MEVRVLPNSHDVTNPQRVGDEADKACGNWNQLARHKIGQYAVESYVSPFLDLEVLSGAVCSQESNLPPNAPVIQWQNSRLLTDL